MPLLYDPLTCIISYQGTPAGKYTFMDGVGQVTLAFTCPCDSDEVRVVLMGLHEGLAHLKGRHPKTPSLPFTLETTIHYEARPEGNDGAIEDRVGLLKFSLSYECDADEWIVPLSYFHGALNRLKFHQHQVPLLVTTIETDESDIAETNNTSILYLTEKEIKQDGYKWRFHKNDADHWPSNLHGHDYERRLKLDVYTGRIYDAFTRQHWKTLKPDKLNLIQEKLRSCQDYSVKLREPEKM